MEFSKPKVTIDLEEYNYLKLVKDSNEVKNALTMLEMEQLLGHCIKLSYNGHSLCDIHNIIKTKLNIYITFTESFYNIDLPSIKFAKIIG